LPFLEIGQRKTRKEEQGEKTKTVNEYIHWVLVLCINSVSSNPLESWRSVDKSAKQREKWQGDPKYSSVPGQSRGICLLKLGPFFWPGPLIFISSNALKGRIGNSRRSQWQRVEDSAPRSKLPDLLTLLHKRFAYQSLFIPWKLK